MQIKMFLLSPKNVNVDELIRGNWIQGSPGGKRPNQDENKTCVSLTNTGCAGKMSVGVTFFSGQSELINFLVSVIFAGSFRVS